MLPRFSRSLVTALVSCLCLAIPACSDSSESDSKPLLGPPSVHIDSPEDGTCVVARSDDENTVSVSVSTTNWTMRPPGFCGETYEQCGFAVFFVDDVAVAKSASVVTDLPFVQALPENTQTPSTHTIRVELHGDDNVVQLDHDGNPLQASVEVNVAPAETQCP